MRIALKIGRQRPLTANMSKWTPTPGMLATYVGRTKAQTRNVIVVAEGCKGYMVVDAIGRQGRNVRLTVKRTSLNRPQPDLFLN